MRKSSMLNLLKPWSRQASGARTHPGGVPGDEFLPHRYVSLKLNHDQDDEIYVYSKRIYRYRVELCKLCCDCYWLDMVLIKMGKSALWFHGKWMT